ncbi:rhomboid family intramembrane serine protease [bacterium]|nr:rhomboid family intramembrane serine protease [bacterium]
MPTYHYTSSSPGYSVGQPWTPAVKKLIIANVVVFLLQLLFGKNSWMDLMALQIPQAVTEMRLWQPFTYMFLHGGFWHLAFNMFALWMFGCDVEQKLGTRLFYIYYIVSGLGAGICVAVVGKLAGEQSITVGASGAIFGILMAYGILFAEKIITLLVFFILPVRMKAKTMVLLFGAFEFLAGVGNALGNVSHLAHLSGLLVGYLFFRYRLPQYAPQFSLFQQLKLWKAGKNVRKMDSELEIDQILDKISREGIGSLSRREREILHQASQRKRGNGPGAN